MSWKVHGTDEVFAGLRGLCSNSYRMYDPCEHRYYYDHECDAYECVVEDAAEEYERLLRHCDHQREQLARHEMEDGMDNIDGGTEVERIEGSSKVRAGSSITDELREWVHEAENDGVIFVDPDSPRSDIPELLGIADRIDAEHEKAIRELNNLADASVLLPVDADGVPIHVGDRMAFEDGEEFDVIGISDSTLFYVDDDFADAAAWTQACNKHHVKPDSWERIIEDALTVGWPNGDWSEVASAEIHDRLVERCRRLAERKEAGS